MIIYRQFWFGGYFTHLTIDDRCSVYCGSTIRVLVRR